MCLDTITGYKSDPEEIRGAWKIGMDLTASFLTLVFNHHLPYSKWIEDDNIRPIRTPGSTRMVYEPGFHCYENKLDHPDFMLTQVFVKKIVARGIQGEKKVLVAQKIYIPNPHSWPWRRDWWIRTFGAKYLPKESS